MEAKASFRNESVVLGSFWVQKILNSSIEVIILHSFFFSVSSPDHSLRLYVKFLAHQQKK
jgi:hypothetical protein